MTRPARSTRSSAGWSSCRTSPRPTRSSASHGSRRGTPTRRSESSRDRWSSIPAAAARHGNLGTALMMTGRTKEAITQYELHARIDDDDARAHSDLGTALLATNDLERVSLRAHASDRPRAESRQLPLEPGIRASTGRAARSRRRRIPRGDPARSGARQRVDQPGDGPGEEPGDPARSARSAGACGCGVTRRSAREGEPG